MRRVQLHRLDTFEQSELGLFDDGNAISGGDVIARDAIKVPACFTQALPELLTNASRERERL